MKTGGLELESSAEWFYDSTAEGGWLGAICEEHKDKNGDFINRKSYSYDELGRPIFELRNYDEKWYYTTLQYGEFSRVSDVGRYWRPQGKEGPAYNSDPEWNIFSTTNIYNNYGALLEVRDAEGNTWWECGEDDYDQAGRLTEFVYGNGLKTVQTYNQQTGRVEGLSIWDQSSVKRSDYQFRYDRIGNLISRTHSRLFKPTLTETGSYDALNRLLGSSISGVTNYAVSATYDALGNLQSRSDVGSYLYGSSRPHAVTSAGGCDYIYDSNGNVIRRDRNGEYEFTAIWNSFNKPFSLFSGQNGSEFEYGVDGKRTRQLIFENGEVRKKIYVAETYEIEEKLLNPTEPNRSLWQWEQVHSRIYVDTPAGKVGIYEQAASTNGTGAIKRSWIHKDHLGSVIATSGEQGTDSLVFQSYDAWGNRRDAADWSPLNKSAIANLKSAMPTDRGYTGHEQLDHLQLVHMNGRIYDPVIGKMISPDPIIQSPDNLQSFNRYAYVWNNPLSYNDPSGFITSGLDKVLGSASSDSSVW